MAGLLTRSATHKEIEALKACALQAMALNYRERRRMVG
jgi:hypothetical protein